jgi:fluoride exporter
MFKNFLLVGLGGAIGSMLRYAISLLVTVKQFPYGTFIVNIAGSFIIGAVLALSLKNELFSNNWKIFLATGICGGFTTFSAFAAENMALLQSGKYGIALMYILASLLLGIAAVVLGFKLITPNS